jgi:hypothetical protein
MKNNNNDITFNKKGNVIRVTMIVEDNSIDIEKIFMGIDCDCPQYEEVTHAVKVSDEHMKLYKSLGKDKDQLIKQFITFIYEYQFNVIKRDLRKAEGNYKRAVTYLANHPDVKPETKEKYVAMIMENKQNSIELELLLKDLKGLIYQLYLKYSDKAYIEIQEIKLRKRIDRKLNELAYYSEELVELLKKKHMLSK